METAASVPTLCEQMASHLFFTWRDDVCVDGVFVSTSLSTVGRHIIEIFPCGTNPTKECRQTSLFTPHQIRSLAEKH